MYGSFSFTTFLGVVAVVALVVALSFLATPLIAVLIVIPLAIVGLVVMTSQRQRSDAAEGGRPTTPAGSTTSPTGSRSGGKPASGEGEV